MRRLAGRAAYGETTGDVGFEEPDDVVRCELPQRVDALRNVPFPLLASMVGAFPALFMYTNIISGALWDGDAMRDAKKRARAEELEKLAREKRARLDKLGPDQRQLKLVQFFATKS